MNMTTKKYIAVLALILTIICAGMCACAEIPDADQEAEHGAETGGKHPETNDDSHVEMPAGIPEDFNICFKFGIGADNIYDTYTGTIQKDLVTNGVATAEFTPSEETLREIYAKSVEYDIYSITREMTSSVLTTDDTLIRAEPNTYYEITITAGGGTHTVKGDYTAWEYTETDTDADNFMQFVRFMIETLYDEPEYQKLPDAVGGYD